MSGNNALIIMSDEHTRSVMGAYGNPLARTPALDRLAAAGVRFDHAYTPSPICISARASFATGTQVFENRCWSSAEPYYGQQQSWMMRLRERGHAVVSIGKLHYRAARDDCGFSQSILPMYLANGGVGWPDALLRKPLGEFAEAREMAAILGPGETSYTEYDRKIAAAAVDWLGRNAARGGKPWVLFVSFVSPHFPLSAPREYYDLYRDLNMPPAFGRDPATRGAHPVVDAMRRFWNYADYFDPHTELEGLRNYYGLCSFLDANTAQVIAALERSGQRDNTQIIYTSDHGDMIGNHGIWGKCFMYEDSAGIPLTLSGPGIDPGVNPTPVSLVDIGATVEQAVCGQTVEAEQAWRGRPLQGFVERAEPERPVLSEYHDGGSPCGVFMLRQGRWKYVYFAENNPPQLFDLESDPRELHDLAADPAHAVTLQRMRDRLFEIIDPEAVNREAFADQARMIDALGGIDAINAIPSFNHTPLESA